MLWSRPVACHSPHEVSIDSKTALEQEGQESAVGMRQGNRASDSTLKRFYQRWGIELRLPPELRTHVQGHVVEWTGTQVGQLYRALVHLPASLIYEAMVHYIFVDQHLQCDGIPHEGIAYEFEDQDEPKWVGLHTALFTQGEQEPYLGVPLLWARLLEEMVHVWDFRLVAAGEPYASAGVEWLRVECDEEGRPRPFNIPNRKEYDLIAEDWASAILWYVWQPDELQRRSPERYAFVVRLFQRYEP